MQKKKNTVLLQISICPVYSFRYVTALSDPIFTNRLETWSFLGHSSSHTSQSQICGTFQKKETFHLTIKLSRPFVGSNQSMFRASHSNTNWLILQKFLLPNYYTTQQAASGLKFYDFKKLAALRRAATCMAIFTNCHGIEVVFQNTAKYSFTDLWYFLAKGNFFTSR